MKKIYKSFLGLAAIMSYNNSIAQCPTPTSVTASPSVICAGQTSSLNATAAGASIRWYTVATCGIPTGTSANGANFTVSPVNTTTYYAESFSPPIAGGSATLFYTGCLQQVVIPAGVTQITIDARGAQGGNSPGNAALGGLGARMIGTFSVTPGQTLNVLVGGQGAQKPNDGGSNYGGGGGGGSFVWTSSVNPWVAAGGGGGGWQTTAGGNGLSGTSGGNSTNGATGGTGGNGGNSPANWCDAGGGGGWFTGGQNSQCVSGTTLQGGGTYSTFVAGLCTSPCTAGVTNYGTNGGYGGGASCWHAGGGGGGYSGGGGGANSAGNGGGGGSYNAGTNQSNTSGFQSGSGLVIIQGISGGCTSVARTPVTVTVAPTPSLSISGGTAAVCGGSSVTLTGNGATSYTWSNGPQTATSVVTPTITSTYTVTGSNGTCTANAFKTVTVNPTPVIAINGNTLICGTGTNILTASGADTYSWNNGANTASVSLSPTTTTNYTVVGTNTLGNCVSSKTVDVLVSTNPTVAITAPTMICVGQSGTITANGASSYSWNTGASSSSIVVSPTTTTDYTVVGTNTAGCSGTSTVSLVVSPCTGVAENTAFKNLSVYPNPNNGEFVIELANGMEKTVVVTDVSGRVVKTINSKNNSIKVNISDLAQGMYHVKVSSDNKSQTLQVIKQ